MCQELSSSAQKVQDVLEDFGLSLQVVELPASTRSAVDAAETIGCELGQIIKSIIFKGKRTHRAILVLASGKNRIDERVIEVLIKEPLGKANADFVRQATGFAIGGVPPVGHNHEIETYIDRDLLDYEMLWAAAGTPNAIFALTPEDLTRISPGRVVSIK